MDSTLLEQAYNIRLNAVRLARRNAAGDARLSVRVEAILKEGVIPSKFFKEQPILADIIEVALEMKELING